MGALASWADRPTPLPKANAAHTRDAQGEDVAAGEPALLLASLRAARRAQRLRKKERRREARQAAQPARPFPPPGDHPDEPMRGTGTAGLCAELREAHAAVPAPVPDRPSGCSPPSAPVGPQAVQRPSLGAASFDIDSQVSGIRSAHTMSKVPTSVSASSCHTLRAAAPRDGSVATPAGRHRAGPYPAHHDKGYGYGSR